MNTNMNTNLFELRRDADQRYSAMMNERAEWEERWRRMASQFAPGRGRFSHRERGKTDAIRLNSRPRVIADEFAAGLKSGLTSQSRQWFSLTVTDPQLMEYESVKAWCNDSTEAMHGQMGRSNLYDEITAVYKEEGIFGTGCLFIEEDDEEVFRCRAFTAGQYAIGQDARQRVNRFARRLAYSAAGLAKEFGEEALPPEILMNLRQRQNGTLHDSLHDATYEVRFLVEENTDYEPDAPGSRGMKYRAMHWLAGSPQESGGRAFLRVGGYEEFPAMVPRWRLVGDDLYGSEHPGEIGLDDAFTLQDIEADERRALKLSVKPPMTGPSTLAEGKIDLRPGAFTLFDVNAMTNTPLMATPLFNVNFNHQAAAEKVYRLCLDLEKAFYVDLFRMWATDMRKGRTATEVNAREEEKMYALEPVLNRLMYDLLDPVVTRVFYIMYRRGLLPPLPPELDGVQFKIEYTSVLARIQKQSSQGGLETLLAVTGQIAQLQAAGGQSGTGRPEILDKLDYDTILDQFADMYAITGAVYGNDQVRKIREERADAEQEMQAANAAMQASQAAPGMARAAKDLSGTPVGDANALEALMGTMGTGGAKM